MKYVIRVLSVVIVILIFIQVLKSVRLDNSAILTPPENKDVPVAGTWQVKSVESFSGTEDDEKYMKQYIDAKASFSDETAIVFNERCELPQYKYKNISSEQFMTYNKNFGINLEDSKLNNKNAEIVSVSSQEKHFYDLFLLGKQQMAVIVIKGVIYFDKVSSSFENIEYNKNIALSDAIISSNSVGTGVSRSGVLLGIKSIKDSAKGEMPAYSYKTLWIAAQNKVLLPVKEVENLLVPRQTGFWKIEMDRENFYGNVYDKMLTYPLESGQIKANRSSELVNTASNYAQNILFIGNDYVSVEYLEKVSSQAAFKLKTVPINKPNAGKVTISDIYGEKSRDVLIGSAKNYLQSSNLSKEIQSSVKISDESFGIARKNGHWITKGRLNIDDGSKNGTFKDYNINLSPVPKLAYYDTMNLNWSDIKVVHPDCKDIFVSPNDDFAILMLDNELLIYTIKNNKLLDECIGKVRLSEGDSVVMAEWATGDYMDIWNRTVEKDSKGVNY